MRQLHPSKLVVARQMLAAAMLALVVAACVTRNARPHVMSSPTERVQCIPASQRAGAEFGCFLLSDQRLGQFGAAPVFWYLDQFPSRASAESARGARGTVVESFGSAWLFTIDSAGLKPLGGTRVGQVGPLPVSPGTQYTAQYMEGVFRPGMKTPVHRHAGPEAWYTLTGETCLETPQGTMVGRAGGPPVIVPGGPPMELTATGSETRRALVLILHDAAQPYTLPASGWAATGACTRDAGSTARGSR
jgi:quercetin dioxygenase-like cupin family protein